MNRLFTHRFYAVMLGVFFGLHVPVGIFIYKAARLHQDWWRPFLKHEINHNGEIYLVAAVVGITFFAIVCAFFGGRFDELENIAYAAHVSNAELSKQAATDGLTKLYNGATIRERLLVEIDNAFRAPLSCLLIDIDFFKRINDKYGHAAGDAALVQVASVVKTSVRRLDVAGRLGGEEFLVLLPDTALERAILTAERIRQNVGNQTVAFGEQEINVTVSIGVANSHMPDLPKEELLRAADAALYQAKRTGRNRVCAWQTDLGFGVRTKGQM